MNKSKEIDNLEKLVFEENYNTEDISFTVHKRMEFTSTWKWMSILVTDHEAGKFKLYTKGADVEIFKWLSFKNNCPKMIENVKKYIIDSS